MLLNMVLIAPQAPASTGFSRQGYWSGLPFPSPGDLPDPGIEPVSLVSPALPGGLFSKSLGGVQVPGGGRAAPGAAWESHPA